MQPRASYCVLRPLADEVLHGEGTPVAWFPFCEYNCNLHVGRTHLFRTLQDVVLPVQFCRGMPEPPALLVTRLTHGLGESHGWLTACSAVNGQSFGGGWSTLVSWSGRTTQRTAPHVSQRRSLVLLHRNQRLLISARSLHCRHMALTRVIGSPDVLH